MNPGTINTILNTAPMLIQGAGKLVKMLRSRDEDNAGDAPDIPASLEGLKQELEKMETRLDANDESSLTQARLIEELARQNEALAGSLKKTMKQVAIISAVAVLALLVALGLLFVGRF